MIRFNNYTTNTLDDMFYHIQEDCEAAGLTLKSRDASSVTMTDGTYYIGFKNATTYLYASVSLSDTWNGNYLDSYIIKFDSSNNFYSGGVYNCYFGVAKYNNDYVIGVHKTTSVLQNFPQLFARFKTSSGRYIWMDTITSGWKYYDDTATYIGFPSHQIGNLTITESLVAYKRNLNITGAGGTITDNEFFLNLFDVCFAETQGDRKFEYLLNDGRYICFFGSNAKQSYIFKHEEV